MAKKNSSKTATEKAIQSSEPRVTTYRGWKGVNYVDSPLTWEPLEQGPGKYRQSDLPANYLMVQNNLVTTPTLGVETRDDSIVVGKLPLSMTANGCWLTGISDVYRHWLFVVCRIPVGSSGRYRDVVLYRSLLDNNIEFDPNNNSIRVEISNPSVININVAIKEIGFYEGNMVATVEQEGSSDEDNTGYVCLAKVDITDDGSNIEINGMDWTTRTETLHNALVATLYIDDPVTNKVLLYENDWPFLEATGMQYQYTAPNADDPNEDNPNAVVRLDVVFDYVNRMGSTLVSYPATIYVEYSPTLWSSAKYVKISSRNHSSNWGDIYTNPSWTPPAGDRNDPNLDPTLYTSATGIDFYAREQENTDYVFIGHIDLQPGQDVWEYNWLGNMTDTAQWVNSQRVIPSENTSRGPNVTHFSSHDSRIYYWGEPSRLYRLYIGGDPGAEFSIARGLGGAWIDIEPGSGYEISGTAKWKTSQGANIVTILCGNRNTNKVKRFNLVETNLTYTNEISYKSYMYEEVSNVVGCNSRYGYGVYNDGLYCLSRYGLVLTTMAMEYNNQMKTQDISEVIKPIFTERIGDRLRDGRMVCIDNVIYIALSEDTTAQTPINLDNVIICYDIGLQAWYTFTHDQVLGHGMGEDPDKIHHILAIDSDEYIEGLGAITDTHVIMYPTTGLIRERVPEFQILLETGELIPKMPKQTFDYIEQLEFRFDYFIGNPEDPAVILIEGIDYYGRSFEITKYLNLRSRGHHGLEGEQRSYTEWVRIGKLVQSLRIRIKGHARFRLTHIVNKMYTQSDRIGTPYGFDASDSYYNRHRGKTKIHHYINDYNNLRDAVVS